MKTKKVLMVHNFYQIGGGEHTVFENEVKLLRDHGHEVIEYTRSNDELKKSKIKLIFSPFSTLWSFRTYRDVKRLIKEKNIDIVHCHNTFPLISPSVYYAARKCGVPVVQTIHNFRFLCPNGTFFCDGKVCELCRENGNFRSAIKNKCYRDSTIQTLIVVAMLTLHRFLGTYKKINYIFLTEFNKEKFKDLIDINGKNVFVKPNFVDVKQNQGDSREKGQIVKFVCAGRLEENKGIGLLIERWKSLSRDYYLHIYGYGTLKDQVEKATKEQENVQYFGFKSQDEIFRDLRSSYGLIFPSIWYEGFPMIIAESFALGVPVLTTSMGNQADVINQSCGGVTFDPESEQSFSSAIKMMISDNKLLSENARNYYQSTLNADSNYASIEEIYNSAEIYGGGTAELMKRKYLYLLAVWMM